MRCGGSVAWNLQERKSLKPFLHLYISSFFDIKEHNKTIEFVETGCTYQTVLLFSYIVVMTSHTIETGL